MTDLPLFAQQILVQDPALLASGLLGVDSVWDKGWVFPHVPGANIENSQKCAIVITEDTPWADANSYNRAEFGTIVVDMWADPTRRANKNVRRMDAQSKIRDLSKIVMKNLHLVNSAVSIHDPAFMGAVGMPRIWGTAAQVADRSGLVIVTSIGTERIRWNPMANNPGGWRGSIQFNLQFSS